LKKDISKHKVGAVVAFILIFQNSLVHWLFVTRYTSGIVAQQNYLEQYCQLTDGKIAATVQAT